MGLDRTIRFPTSETPTWEGIKNALARVGEPAPLRMIDGLPAFPDETPDPTWKELRIGSAAGMITVRRGPGVLTCIIWGNANSELDVAWARVIWACAEAGGGQIDTPTGPQLAADFARGAGFLPT